MSLREAARRSRSIILALAVLIAIVSIFLGMIALYLAAGIVIGAFLLAISLIVFAILLPLKLLRSLHIFDQRKVVVVYDPALKGTAFQRKNRVRKLLILTAYMIYAFLIIAFAVWAYRRFLV